MIYISKKSKLATMLLCIFFGLTGAHYFYTERIGWGIFYLLTFGLLGIGVIIDVIRIARDDFCDSNGLFVMI